MSGTGPVDSSHGSNSTQGTQQDDADYGFDDNYSSNSTSGTTRPGGTKGPTTKGYGVTSPSTGGLGSGVPQGGLGGVSPGGDFGMPGDGMDPQVSNRIQALQNQGYTPEQIQGILQQEFGIQVPLYELDPGMTGGGSARGPNKYGFYAAAPLTRNYGSYGGYGGPFGSYLQQYLQNQQMMQDARESARQAKSHGRQEMVKMHMILFLIMMGDVVGALRAYTALMERDFRQFARGVMDKLGKVRQARARVIRNFANERPPRAYAGDNPQTTATAQDKAQRYTQFVQLSTQLMGELQTTERELVDILQTMKRDIDNFWQGYASMRDAEGRVNERLMTTR